MLFKKFLQLRPAAQHCLQPLRTCSNSPPTESTKLEKTVNNVNLLGRVGADPQKRGSEEHPVVIFSMATHLNYKYTTGELVQKTEWHRVCVFKPSLRENVYRYLHKGQRVFVNGRLTYGETKNEEGNVLSSTAIVAEEVIFLQDNTKK